QGEEERGPIAENVEQFLPGHRFYATEVEASQAFHQQSSSFLPFAASAGKSYKNVLETGLGRKHLDSLALQIDPQLTRRHILIDERTHCLAEDRRLVHGWVQAQAFEDASHPV